MGVAGGDDGAYTDDDDSTGEAIAEQMRLREAAGVSTPEAAGPPPMWSRVLLKVSGEALRGANDGGIDPARVHDIAVEVAGAVQAGVQVAIVVGGGNFIRGRELSEGGMDRASADYMGMLATVMNSLSLQAALEGVGVPTRVQTAIEMRQVAEPYIRRKAIRHLERGRVVIFGAGTGNPFFSTDTCAALRAAEINAECVLKATNVEGIFDKDPRKHADASCYDFVTYRTVVEAKLSATDLTAITLCEENSLPLVLFDMGRSGNILRAVLKGDVGTLVAHEDTRGKASQ
eukprot:PRCOL_00004727-RA